MDRISAFIDGEASRMEAQQTIMRLRQDGDCLENWQTFHLIGDVLRGSPALSTDFARRFHERIALEPTVLAPRYTVRRVTGYALSAAASLAAVAVVLSLVLSDNPLMPQPEIAATAVAEPTEQIAALPQPVSAANQGRVNEYLMAHQQFSPSTTLQGVAPYVRTVSAPRDSGTR